MEADGAAGADRADGDGSEYEVSVAVKAVRTCQNSLGQNGTHLGLLLLHVGPNGDGLGGQAFMEHYNAHYFTKLDVHWGYNNVRICEEDKWKATFCTNRGLFEPLVMYFSLTNSPAIFQMMMNKIFQDLITEGIISMYLDDILIFTNSLEEHHRITCLVLDHMYGHKLYLWLEKCEFEKTKIKYLGVIISHNKVEMDPVKIAGVAD
jgi:hypothetical protein